MPRIVPIELLKCLKVLLDDNGGILSAGEVKRIASLMTKYSKKLVSKCIYVQILKCTKTELLGEFMGAGGWSLVYTWLHDAIRAMNWPLVQEILELLLLCPVDMYRLRINSAPKLVKGLCKDGGNEGVRILAKRLVEQWLKIVTENPEGGPVPTIQAQQQQQQQTFSPASSTAMTPIPTCLVKTTEVLAMAPAHLTNAQQLSSPSTSSSSSLTTTLQAGQECVKKENAIACEEEKDIVVKEEKSEDDDNEEDSEEDENDEENATEKDPLAEVQTVNATASSTYALTPAQKKANESGLVYKIVVKDGQQVLAKVAKPLVSAQQQQQLNNYGQEITEAEKITDEDDSTTQGEKRHKVIQQQEQQQQKQKAAISSKVKRIVEQEEETTSSSIDKIDKESENSNSSSSSSGSSSSSSSSGTQEGTDSNKFSHKPNTVAGDKDKKEIKRIKEEKKLMEKPKEIVQQQQQQHSPSLSLSPNRLERENKKILKETKERHSSGSNNAGGAANKEKERDGKKSSSSHKSSSSSSSHKSSSSKSSSTSTSTSTSNKTKSSSSSSSSAHRSSSDKHKDKEPRPSSSTSATSSTTNKDKERSSSSSSNSSSSKHKSSSSSSTTSSTKDKYRDKEREKSNSGHKSKERTEKENTTAITTKTTTTTAQLFQNSNDKDHKTSSTTTSPSMDKLGRIPKKSQQNKESDSLATTVNNKPISINIPSKKSSISIEIRKDTDRAKTVKTYKSQFRSHGLTEEAPPPPSRKGLKKPSSSSHSTSGVILPTSLPSSSMKRSSPPPPRDSPTIEKKAKIDLNNIAYAVNDKPGAIKLIPPKKIQTLVETNLFSDALSAATGPKKLVKRKKPTTTTTSLSSTANILGSTTKEEPSPPISPDLTKVVRLKFYQDTLEDTKTDDNKSDKEGGGDDSSKDNLDDSTSSSLDKLEKDIEDDDDIPLKKVKEDIEQKVAKERNQDLLCKFQAAELANENKLQHTKMAENDTTSATKPEEVTVKKPGPGCGPNGPPGVLVIHRRKGPKKKLKWCPPETLEQIRYFELDETERVNVTKTSFMDMKNLERFNERDAIIMSRRGFHREDNMEVQTTWRPLIEVDDVPPHPDGSQSKQRKIQAEREMTTLRALYFSQAIIPDSPAEAEIEPVFTNDIPIIPLDDITRNPDAVNDFTSMPWPDSKGSPKQGDSLLEGTGGLGSPMDMFSTPIVNSPALIPTPPVTAAAESTNKATPVNPFNPFVPPFANTVNAANQHVTVSTSGPPNPWQSSNMNNNNNNNNNNMAGISLPFGPPSNIDMPITAGMMCGPMGNNNNNNNLNGPQQNFIHQFGPGPHPFGIPTNQFGPSNVMFNGPGNNFCPLGANNIMMGVGPMGIPPLLMNQRSGNNRNSGGGNWRTGSNNYADNWRSGPPNRGGSGNSSGVCKAYMRGHCRLGKSCKYIHPRSKRI